MGNESSSSKLDSSGQLRKAVLDQVTKLPMRERAFLRACCHAEIEQIKSLIDSNVNPNITGLTHCSPLHFVICAEENPNPAEVIKLLLRNDVYPLSTAKNGASAVHCAVVNQENCETSAEIIKALIYDQFSAKQLLMVDNEGNTPLHLAAQLGKTSIFVDLLHLAEKYDCLSLCLEKSNVTNKTVLHLTKSPTIARIILTHAPNLVNRQDDQGRTALHFAVTKKNLSVTSILLEYNALPDISDRSNFSPLSLVQLPSHKKDVDYLLENNLVLYNSRFKKQQEEERLRKQFTDQFNPNADQPSRDPVADLQNEIQEMKLQHEKAITLLRLEYDEKLREMNDKILLLTAAKEELAKSEPNVPN